MYTYNDMKDKSAEGICKEVADGFVKVAFYFETTLGIPVEVFREWVEERLPDNARKLWWYVNFRSEYPKLFKE